MRALDLYFDAPGTSCSNRSMHPEVWTWCNYVRMIMELTGIFDRKFQKFSLWVLFSFSGKFSIRPLLRKLSDLDIIDEKTGRTISFLKLKRDQKRIFMDQLLEEEGRMLTEKIAMVPQLADCIAQENSMIFKILAMEGLFRPGRSSYEDMVMGYTSCSFDIFANYPHTAISNVKNIWSGKVRRGDILLALPKQGAPWIYANINPKVTSKMGHIGILTVDIDEKTDIYSKCTVECRLKKGVHERAMKNWDTPHYVVGIQRVKWFWNAESHRLRKEVQPIENLSVLADIAERFIGRRYVKWYEVACCKWVAPKRFTCSTLLWWCAKKAYGFTISNWLFAFTTPSDILRNPAIFIKAEVK